VAGAHDVAKLDALLELFIKKYVQCHACGNPETRIKIRKDMIHLMCKVLGGCAVQTCRPIHA
jgi:translation initiation factor 5